MHHSLTTRVVYCGKAVQRMGNAICCNWINQFLVDRCNNKANFPLDPLYSDLPGDSIFSRLKDVTMKLHDTRPGSNYQPAVHKAWQDPVECPQCITFYYLKHSPQASQRDVWCRICIFPSYLCLLYKEQTWIFITWSLKVNQVSMPDDMINLGIQ